MSRAQDLVGLGMHPFLAKNIGNDITNVTAGGGSAGSATQMLGGNRTVYVIASNSGSGVLLPQVGGDNGANLGDRILLANLLSAAIQVYCADNGLGSAITIYIDGTSIAGTTGFSASSGKPLLLTPITVSTWLGMRSA